MKRVDKLSEFRAQRLQLLALGFAHPTPELHRLLVSGDYSLALAQTGARLELPSVKEASFEDFEAAYIQLFQVGKRGRPQVSLNAADHAEVFDGGDRPQFLLGYSAWYRHFGLKTAEGEGANELPDHLLCQLEFLCWLAHLQSVNDTDTGYALAQRDFCRRHLAQFLESLITALQSGESTATRKFYLALAVLALETVDELLEDYRNLGTPLAVSTEEKTDVVNLWG